MKNKKTRINKTNLSIIGIIVIVFFTSVFAQQPAKQAGESPASTESQTETLAKTEKTSVVKREDFFLAGQSVEVKSENAVGDVAVAGANITVSDEVQGYVMAAGANINMNAPVGNDLWLAGANVFVNAPVADNAMLAGSMIVVGENATIGNDARIAAASVEIKGKIKRNLYITSSTAEISSEIDGNVVAYVENMTLNPDAVVKGNLVLYGPNQPNISPGAKVTGNVQYHETKGGDTQSYTSAIGGWFSSWFLTLLWFVVLGLLAVWFSSVWTNRVAEILKEQTGKSFLVGLVVMLAVPVLFILLMVTIIGIPLSLLVAALALVAFLFSGVFVSYLAGDILLNRLKRWEDSNVLKIIFGALIVTFVMSLPWIGWLAKLAVMFFGVGAFLLERKDLLLTLREQKLA